MDTSSFHLDHEAAGGRQPSTSGIRQNTQEVTHETTHTTPTAQPFEIVIRSAIPSPREDHVLKVVQQPEIAKVAAPREKVRTPLDPPLIVELSFRSQDSNRAYLSSPFFFGNVELIPQRPQVPSDRRQFQSAMIGGSLVSSLHKVRLEDNLDHAFFVFGDLNLKVIGQFQLKFTLFEMHKTADGDFHVVQLGSVPTKTFRAYTSREFPGQMESTHLSKQLCDQGIKLRIRKETSKRKAQSSDWAADQYLHPHGSMSDYSRGSADPFHLGYDPNDQRSVRYRYSTTYPTNAAAEFNRYLPGIPTLPPGATLPQPLAHSSYAAPPLPSPATAFPSESGFQPLTRHPPTSTTMPELYGSPAWSRSSTMGDASSYAGRREQNPHDHGNRPNVEHSPGFPTSSRFPRNSVPYQEIPFGLSPDRQYSRRMSTMPGYDNNLGQTRPDYDSNSFVSDSGHPRISAPSATLPPIDPGPYRSGTQQGSAPSIPLQPETAMDGRAAYPRQPQNQLNGAMGDQQQKTPSRNPEP